MSKIDLLKDVAKSLSYSDLKEYHDCDYLTYCINNHNFCSMDSNMGNHHACECDSVKKLLKCRYKGKLLVELEEIKKTYSDKIY